MKSGSNLSGMKVQRERETGEERGRLSRMSKTVWLHLHLAPFLIVDIKLHQNFTFDGWRRGQITTEEKSKMLAGGSASRIRDPACCYTSADPAAMRGNCDHF